MPNNAPLEFWFLISFLKRLLTSPKAGEWLNKPQDFSVLSIPEWWFLVWFTSHQSRLRWACGKKWTKKSKVTTDSIVFLKKIFLSARADETHHFQRLAREVILIYSCYSKSLQHDSTFHHFIFWLLLLLLLLFSVTLLQWNRFAVPVTITALISNFFSSLFFAKYKFCA